MATNTLHPSYPIKASTHLERDRMLSELGQLFSELSSKGWDGYGAHPIQKKAYLNAVEIVRNTPETILKLWNTFPAPNGTISFEFKEREVAMMSVGIDGFSFAAMKDDEDPIMGEMDFDAIKASETLIRMSNLFDNANSMDEKSEKLFDVDEVEEVARISS